MHRTKEGFNVKSTRTFRTKMLQWPRRSVVLAAALLFLAAATVGWAQEQEAPDAFVRALLRCMEVEGWDTSESGALFRYLHTYRWENLKGVDAEAVGLALGLVRRQQEQLRPEDTAQLAYRLALMAREMQTLGFEPGQITRAAVNGVRAVLVHAERLRPGETAPELSEAIKECLNEQIRLQERLRLQQRTRLRTNFDSADGWPSMGSKGGGRPH
jgi:hypothetical protein